jgi:hypothetical protein
VHAGASAGACSIWWVASWIRTIVRRRPCPHYPVCLCVRRVRVCAVHDRAQEHACGPLLPAVICPSLGPNALRSCAEHRAHTTGLALRVYCVSSRRGHAASAIRRLLCFCGSPMRSRSTCHVANPRHLTCPVLWHLCTIVHRCLVDLYAGRIRCLALLPLPLITSLCVFAFS